jgi:hypothetical protein
MKDNTNPTTKETAVPRRGFGSNERIRKKAERDETPLAGTNHRNLFFRLVKLTANLPGHVFFCGTFSFYVSLIRGGVY